MRCFKNPVPRQCPLLYFPHQTKPYTRRMFLLIFSFLSTEFPASGWKTARHTHQRSFCVDVICAYGVVEGLFVPPIERRRERTKGRETERRPSSAKRLYTCLVSWIFVFRINSARSNGCHGGPEIASRASPSPTLKRCAMQFPMQSPFSVIETYHPTGYHRDISVISRVIG